MRAWFDILRLQLVWWLFPCKGRGIVANRTIQRYETGRMEMTLTLRDKRLYNGLSREEMMKALDTFLRREVTQEEWQQVLKWAGVPV